MVTRESLYFINVRNAYMLSPLYASRMSSRTVLFTSLPTEFMTDAKIRAHFGNKAKNVWSAAQTKDLENNVEQRDKAAIKLEGGETKLIKLCNNARLKSIKKGGKGEAQGAPDQSVARAESGQAASRWIKPKERPTHKLGKFGLYGKKVDTVNWCRSELQRLIPVVKEQQHMHRSLDAKPTTSVFVEFWNQTEAQDAYQHGIHDSSLVNEPRIIGMTPGDVIWKNLNMSKNMKKIRNILTITAVVLTIIFWYVLFFVC